MAATLTINRQHTDGVAGVSSFVRAESVGVRVPTSCVKNGKCKGCLIEVTSGEALLSARTVHERKLKGGLRLSCQTTVIESHGQVACQTMRRGQMRIERQAHGLPTTSRLPT